MEKSKRELESLVNSQKEQLLRYESRLKDVVTAYKGLLKEKDALESSLAAVTSGGSTKIKSNSHADDTSTIDSTANAGNEEKQLDAKSSPRKSSTNTNNDMNLPIPTLMNSLATLSAEKSRMEASFQGDKKKLRNELMKKDEIIAKMEEKIKEFEKQNAIKVDNIKSKMIIERHEREKETNNHMIMIRELQKLYADERHLKENLEMQLNDLKGQISSWSTSGGKMKDMANELRDTKEALKKYENNKDLASTSATAMQENQTILQQLQNEMKHLKEQHAVAIRAEQKRVLLAEDRSKKLAALHEDRVANLEARLAELSSTVGSYDRLRQQDQENIQKLKDKIAKFTNHSKIDPDYKSDRHSGNTKQSSTDVQTLYNEMLALKKVILIENARSKTPIDLSKLFNASNNATIASNNGNTNDHLRCQEDTNKLEEELDKLRLEHENNLQLINEQKQNIRTLQEKVKVLNRNIDEQEVELKFNNEKLAHAISTEKHQFKLIKNTLESEYRSKVNDLEQQLQKQRVRSLQLLEEKENEIKALQTSIEIFIPHQQHPQVISNNSDNNNGNENHNRRTSASHIQNLLTTSNAAATNCTSQTNINNNENCHMIHYANEIARKDVEISGLRKAKHMAESSLRQALQDKVTTQEGLHDTIDNLQRQVDRLECCKSREGANLEYLKNVFISLLSTTNREGKRHMINAIAAVLKFTSEELKAINVT